MKRDDTVYLHHILDAIESIRTYLLNTSADQFKQNRMVQDAVIRQIEIISEAAKHVSSELRTSYPDIPWQDIAGMRDKLIHNYFGVDIDTVWLTAKRDIPALKADIQKILEKS